MNVMHTVEKLLEPGDREAADGFLGFALVKVGDELWKVDLADMMEQRVPGASCGQRLGCGGVGRLILDAAGRN